MSTVRAEQAFFAPQVAPIELAVIVPTYNERENLYPLVQRLKSCLSGISWELVFVDDDSRDGTADEVRLISEFEPNVRVVQRIGRRGLASACVEGMLATSAPFLAVMDADLQHDESIVPKMFGQIRRGNLDLVVATRNAGGGSKGQFDRRRVVISDWGAKLSSLVLKTPLSDPMSGFFMITRECLHGLVRRLSGVGFKILVDIVASADRPLKVAEVPYVFGQRRFGESKLDVNVAVEYFNLLVDKLTRGLLPARFVMFMLVGGSGVVVHVTALSILFAGLHRPFVVAQTAATIIAMTSNFFLNNMLTFRDCRLHGARALRGLLLFYLVCSFGVFTNVTVAYFIFKRQLAWYLAGIVGIAVSSVWNYAINSLFTWRKSR